MHTTIEFGSHTVQVPLAQKQAHNPNTKLELIKVEVLFFTGQFLKFAISQPV